MKTVLVIDSDAHLRKLISQWLAEAGWRVLEIDDGERIVEFVQRRKYVRRPSPALGRALAMAMPNGTHAQSEWSNADRSRQDLNAAFAPVGSNSDPRGDAAIDFLRRFRRKCEQ